MKTSVCVIGAGSVGVNAAILLKLHGYEVELLESEPDILRGAGQVSFVNHGDGFEYFTPDHRATGEFCVEGSLAKALMYPLDFLSTPVCTAQRPMRFLVAQSSGIDTAAFKNNAEHLAGHYRDMYREMGAATGLDDDGRERVFGRHPDDFMRMLAPADYADVNGIATGASGTGFGINMPHYYAAVMAALRQTGIRPRCKVHVETLTRLADGYEVRTDAGAFRAGHVVVCSSHHIPALATKIHGAKLHAPPGGTYYLNAMTFLHLPATSDPAKLTALNRINFTLMDEHGGMFACIMPPTATTDGTAAIYFPARPGSHLDRHVCPPGSRSEPPAAWDELIAKGLPDTDARVEATFGQARKLYGFLDGYATVLNTACRTVFNASTPASKGGTIRSVREQLFGDHSLTADGLVTAWAAPKWTNAEFTAAMALGHVLGRSGERQIDFTKADRATVASRLLREEPLDPLDGRALLEDAQHYCQHSPAPRSEAMIVPEAPQFRRAE